MMKKEFSKGMLFFPQFIDGHCLFTFNPTANQKEFIMQKPNHLNQNLKNHGASLASPNKGIDRDLQAIAQNHDLGDQLSDDEITYLLGHVESALYGRSFLHLETLHTLSDAFTSFVKSRCYAANHHTIHIFKKFNLVGVAFDEKEGGEAVVSLLSRGFYQCMEEVAEDFQAKLQVQGCPLEDPTLIEPLKAFVSCLSYFSQGTGDHILSSLAFREALEPYLGAFIQMARTSDVNEEGKVPLFHTENPDLFIQEHGLEKPFFFQSKHHQCHIWANDLKNVFATFIFEKKGATLSLGFSAFDDLLEMGKYVDRFTTFKEKTKEKDSLLLETQGLSFLWSSGEKNKTSGLLRTSNVSFMLDGEETEAFISFLLEVSEQFKEPLKALRSQLGRL